MQDLRLWYRLEEAPANDPEWKHQLDLLAEMPIRQRFVFFDRLEKWLSSDADLSADITSAMLQCFQGASGWTAWRLLLPFLNDDRQAVREAALHSLLQSSRDYRYLWIFLLFHERTEIRLSTIEFVKKLPDPLPKWLLYLLPDAECFDALTTEIQERRFVSTLTLVKQLSDAELITNQQTVRLITCIDNRVLENELRYGDQFPQETIRAILKDKLEAEPVAQDLLHWVMVLIGSFDGPTDEKLNERLTQIHKQLLSILKNPPEEEAEFTRRYCACAMWAARQVGRWGPGLAGDCAAFFPEFLTFDSVPVDVRRHAIENLYLLGTATPPASKSLVKRLLKSELAVQPDGKLDLWFIGGLLFLLRKSPYQFLIDNVRTSDIVDAFVTDPERSVSLFAVPNSSLARTKLLSAVQKAQGGSADYVEALLVFVLPGDSLHALGEPGSSKALGIARQMIDLAQRPEMRLGNKKAGIAASILANHFNAMHFEDFLIEWLDREPFSPFNFASEVLELAIKKLGAEKMAGLMAKWPLPLQHQLLQALADAHGVPFAFEIALAQALKDATDPVLKDWTSKRHLSLAKQELRKAKRKNPKVADLTAKAARKISSCAENKLATEMRHCLKSPTRGLCKTLLMRSGDIEPNLAVCVALLGCHDEPSLVCQLFERYVSHDTEFLSELDSQVVGQWQTCRDLSMLGHAWLYRWERNMLQFHAENLTDEVTLVDLLKAANNWSSQLLAQQVWAATLRVFKVMLYRDRSSIDIFGNHVCILLAEALPGPNGAIAADMLVRMYQAEINLVPLEDIREQCVGLLPELGDEIRSILQPWIGSRGMESFSGDKPAEGPTLKVSDPESFAAAIDDTQKLAEYCRHSHQRVAMAVINRLLELGQEGIDTLWQVLQESPPARHAVLIARTIPVWPHTMWPEIIEWIRQDSAPPEMRFQAGMTLIESGCHEPVDAVVDAAVAESGRAWLKQEDMRRLLLIDMPLIDLCVRLSASPHPPAYRFVLDQFNKMATSDPEIRDKVTRGLRRFLDAGDQRLDTLRIQAASQLLDLGDDYGWPLILQCWGDVRGNSFGIHDLALHLELSDQQLCEAVRCCLFAGTRYVDEHHIDSLVAAHARRGLDGTDEFHQIVMMLMAALVNSGSRQALACDYLKPSESRTRKLRAVAETFAWGIPIGRELTGRLFSVRLIGGDALGYTKLNESRIYINPRAILQNYRYGRDVVEGLILHEYGHHVWHRGEEEEKIWEKAQKEGLHELLNLVSDEHLERNLRAMDESYGNKLKRLGAYAFQHTNKIVEADFLVQSLGLAAQKVLPQARMEVCRVRDCVQVNAGSALQQAERHGASFCRFFRALRMGLGNRYDDPLVEKALKLFNGGFRHNNMEQLWGITLKLRELFGSQCDMLKHFGHDGLCLDDDGEILIDGEGMDDEMVQSEIRRITSKPKSTGSKSRGARVINVGSEMAFDPITQVQRVSGSPDQYRLLAREVLRDAKRFRQWLTELGLAMHPRHRRLQGNRLDRMQLKSALIRRDPRILISRERRFETDLFIGVVIDCSGSMAHNDNIEKARMFGALLAEAARGMPAVDLRLFGFTDSEIYDCGDANHPGISGLYAGGGNNDAGALQYAANVAVKSRRKARLLVMISDGLPTECSVDALSGLVRHLTRRYNMCCAQVAVAPLEEICFPNFVLLDTSNTSLAVRQFGTVVAKLVRKALNR